MYILFHTVGLRPGDPLSPYLFILYVEAFSSHLVRLQSSSTLLGLKASQNGPPVNHIFFADDYLIFFCLSKDLVKVICDSV